MQRAQDMEAKINQLMILETERASVIYRRRGIGQLHLETLRTPGSSVSTPAKRVRAPSSVTAFVSCLFVPEDDEDYARC
jgi:hypothetical protein